MRKQWPVQSCPCRRRLSEDLINVYKYQKGGCKEDAASLFPVVASDRTEAMGTNWNTVCYLWTLGNTFSQWVWLSTGTGCPESLRNLHPWKYSESVWTVLGNLLLVSLLDQRGWIGWPPEVPCNLNCSVITWFWAFFSHRKLRRSLLIPFRLRIGLFYGISDIEYKEAEGNMQI